jgi:hypothetical protein
VAVVSTVEFRVGAIDLAQAIFVFVLVTIVAKLAMVPCITRVARTLDGSAFVVAFSVSRAAVRLAQGIGVRIGIGDRLRDSFGLSLCFCFCFCLRIGTRIGWGARRGFCFYIRRGVSRVTAQKTRAKEQAEKQTAAFHENTSIIWCPFGEGDPLLSSSIERKAANELKGAQALIWRFFLWALSP